MSSSSPNPWLRVSFPLSQPPPSHQIMVRLENLSLERAVHYKIKTLQANLDLFLVSPNPGRLPPASVCDVVVTCRSPEALKDRRAKFMVASQVLDPPSASPGATFPHCQAFSCQAVIRKEEGEGGGAAGRALCPAGSSLAGYRRAAMRQARGRGADAAAAAFCSTPRCGIQACVYVWSVYVFSLL